MWPDHVSFTRATISSTRARAALNSERGTGCGLYSLSAFHVCTSKSVDNDNNRPVREAQNRGRQKRASTLENVRSLGEVGVGLLVTQDGGGGDVDGGGGAGVLVGRRRVDVLHVDAQERRGLHEPLVLHQALYNNKVSRRKGPGE